MSKIAFNTANLVGRVSGYKFELKNWGAQHQATVAATDENEWRAICREIAQCGFKAIEVWEAHAAPETLNEEKAKIWRAIMDEAGLQPVAYAAGLRPETVQVCQWLGIPHIDGGLRLSLDDSIKLCHDTGISFNYENHPETSPQEIMDKIGDGDVHMGVCIDTGWLGTQGLDAPETIHEIGVWMRHLHLKDVKHIGSHETCILGEGIVDIARCVQVARANGYDGWYSWEDEPEDRNPFDSAVQNREYIEKLLA